MLVLNTTLTAKRPLECLNLIWIVVWILDMDSDQLTVTFHLSSFWQFWSVAFGIFENQNNFAPKEGREILKNDGQCWNGAGFTCVVWRQPAQTYLLYIDTFEGVPNELPQLASIVRWEIQSTKSGKCVRVLSTYKHRINIFSDDCKHMLQSCIALHRNQTALNKA